MEFVYFCVILSAMMTIVQSDYKCLCNYNVEKSVYGTHSTNGNVLGYMYEFDCKPAAGDSAENGWWAIAFENKLGFLQKDAQIQIQTCPGSIPDEDKLPSKPTLITQKVTAQLTSTDITETSTKMLTTKPTVGMSTTDETKNVTDAATTTIPVFSTTVTTTLAENLTTSAMPNVAISHSTIGTTVTENLTTWVMSTVATSPSTVTNTMTKALTTAMKPITVQTTLTSSTSVFSLLNTTNVTTSTGKGQTTSLSTHQTDSPSTSTVTEQHRVTTYTPEQTATLSQTSTESTTITTTTHKHPTSGLTELCPSQIQSEAAHRRNTKLTQYGNKCYEVVQKRVSWATAEVFCLNRTGHLADIGSQHEQDFLYHFLESIKSHTVWLGLHDRIKEENFEWSSGKAVTYTNWIPDRKDIFYHNKQDCVYMTVNGTWDDISCGSNDLAPYYLHAYMCQYGTVRDPQLVG